MRGLAWHVGKPGVRILITKGDMFCNYIGMLICFPDGIKIVLPVCLTIFYTKFTVQNNVQDEIQYDDEPFWEEPQIIRLLFFFKHAEYKTKTKWKLRTHGQ